MKHINKDTRNVILYFIGAAALIGLAVVLITGCSADNNDYIKCSLGYIEEFDDGLFVDCKYDKNTKDLIICEWTGNDVDYHVEFIKNENRTLNPYSGYYVYNGKTHKQGGTKNRVIICDKDGYVRYTDLDENNA